MRLNLQGYIDHVCSDGKYAYFTLQLVPYQGDNEPVPEEFLKPWKWGWDSWCQLCSSTHDGDIGFEAKNPSSFPCDDPWLNKLAAGNGPTSVGNDKGLDATPITGYGQEGQILTQKWMPRLVAMQTWGVETSQRFHLNHFFRVSRACIDSGWVVALPKFKFSYHNNVYELECPILPELLGDSTKPAEGEPEEKEFDGIQLVFSSGSETPHLEGTAKIKVSKLYKTKGAYSIIDPASLRIDLSKVNGYSHDWWSALPEKVGGELSLPAVLKKLVEMEGASGYRVFDNESAFLAASFFSIVNGATRPQAGRARATVAPSSATSLGCLLETLVHIAIRDNHISPPTGGDVNALLVKIVGHQPAGPHWIERMNLLFAHLGPGAIVGQNGNDNINAFLRVYDWLTSGRVGLWSACEKIVGADMLNCDHADEVMGRLKSWLTEEKQLQREITASTVAALYQWLIGLTAPPTPDNADKMWFGFRVLVGAALRLDENPGRLAVHSALGWVGPEIWRQLTDCSRAAVGNEIEFVKDKLGSRVDELLNRLPATPSGGLHAKVATALADRLAKRVFGEEDTQFEAGCDAIDGYSLGDDSITPISRGICIAVDRPGIPSSEKDFNRRLAGAVLYVGEVPPREKNPGNFICANMVDFAVGEVATPSIEELSISLPIKPPLVAGQRQPFLEYSGAPLFDGDKRSTLSQRLPDSPQQPPMVPEWSKVSINAAIPMVPLPPLYFGGRYQFLAWAATHFGGYPKEICDGNWPDKARQQLNGVPPNCEANILRYRYMRRTKVGAPALANWLNGSEITVPDYLDGQDEKTKSKRVEEETKSKRVEEETKLKGALLPPLPIDPATRKALSPLAAELRGAEGQPRLKSDEPITVLLPKEWMRDGEEIDRKTKFSFFVGRPQVDDATYMAWFVADWTTKEPVRPADSNWGKRYQELKAALGKRPIAFEDPAVTHVRIKVEILSGGGAKAPDPVVAPLFDNDDGAEPRSGSLERGVRDTGGRRRGLKFTVEASGVGTVQLAQRVLSVPPGYVVRISVASLVPVAKALDRFHPAVISEKYKEHPAEVYYEFGSTSFIVETAAENMPTAVSLRDGLESRPVGGEIVRRLQMPENATMKYVDSAILSSQEWAWNGRPVPVDNEERIVGTAELFRPPPEGFPTNEKWPTEEICAKWDVVGFATRPNTDAIRVERPVVNGGEVDFGPIPLGDHRPARYFRFCVEVRNRYRVWLKDDEVYGRMEEKIRRKLGNTVSSLDAQDELQAWTRLLVKAQPAGRPTTPKLRAIHPLTIAPDGAGAASGDWKDTPSGGWLVVFDGDWFDPTTTPGLAQKLSVELEEFGYDPRLSAEPINKAAYPKLSVIGPVSYSFDFGENESRHNLSAFIVGAEPSKKLPPGSFAKLRFVRERLSDATDQKLMTSEATDAYWVKALGDFSSIRAGNERVNASDLRLRRDKNTLSFVHSDRLLLLKPDYELAAAKTKYQLFAMVFSRATGHAGRETLRFVSGALIDTDGTVKLPDGVEENQPLSVMLAEIEWRAETAPDVLLNIAELVKLLLDPEDERLDRNIKGRIVRLVGPINSV